MAGVSGAVEQFLDFERKIDRRRQSHRAEGNECPVGGEGVPKPFLAGSEDFTHDIFVVLKKQNRSTDDENEADRTQFGRIGQKGIDIVTDRFVRSGNDVGKDEVFDTVVLFAEVGKPHDDRKAHQQHRDQGEDGIKTQTGGVIGYVGVVESFEFAKKTVDS